MNTAFWIISAITLLGAVLAVSLRNLVHCVLSLILFFIGIAAHYFLLRADFLGAVQILLYVGAVAVLILFAIMLTRHVTGQEGPAELGGKWWAGALVAALVAGALAWTVQQEPSIALLLPSAVPEGTAVADIGRALVKEWVVPLEILGVLLTSALIGAVVIALEEVKKSS